jgi:hypothetical protein
MTRPGIRPFCVAMTVAVSGLMPNVPPLFVRWTIVTRATSRAASDVPFIV